MWDVDSDPIALPLQLARELQQPAHVAEGVNNPLPAYGCTNPPNVSPLPHAAPTMHRRPSLKLKFSPFLTVRNPLEPGSPPISHPFLDSGKNSPPRIAVSFSHPESEWMLIPTAFLQPRELAHQHIIFFPSAIRIVGLQILIPLHLFFLWQTLPQIWQSVQLSRYCCSPCWSGWEREIKEKRSRPKNIDLLIPIRKYGES